MRDLLARLRKDKKGNVLVLVGAGMLTLVGGVGLGVDTVQWILWKRQLQQAVDSASLAGGNAKIQGTYTWADYAKKELTRNTDSFMPVTVVRIVSTPQEGAYTTDNNAVEVVATTQRKLPFSGMFLNSPPVLQARAVSTVMGGGEYCVVALGETGVGISVSGTADVLLDCGIATNSKNPTTAFDFNGGSYLQGTPISAVGGVNYASDNIGSDAVVQAYNVPQEDPVGPLYPSSNIPSTADVACSYNNLSVSPSTSLTLTPPSTGAGAGYMRLCNGLTVRGTVKLNPGVYVVDGGSFKLGAGSKITGDGVTIILTGSTSTTVATTDINGLATVNLRAPNAATDPGFLAPEWYGMLFYQDPKAAVSTVTNTNTLTGTSSSTFDGIVYMPSAYLRYLGTSGMKSTCLKLVADRLNFAGEAQIGNNCPSEIKNIEWSTRYVMVVE